jgi:hypothetical protein
MKRYVICLLILAAAVLPASAQDQPGLAERRAMEVSKAQLEGKLRAAVEMRTTAGAPYSAEATTEFVQVLQDGNRIARKSVVRVYRDSEGRVRRENVTLDGRLESVTIVDPVAGNSVILNPETRSAYSEMKAGALPRSASPVARPSEVERRKAEMEAPQRGPIVAPAPLPAMRGELRARVSEGLKTEDLGTRTIEGVSARGTRIITTIAAGAIGNEQPIRIVSEEWFSPDLQVLVLTKHSDPRSGDTTYTLSNITRTEPDRSLFEVPADYTFRGGVRREPPAHD